MCMSIYDCLFVYENLDVKIRYDANQHFAGKHNYMAMKQRAII